MITQEEKQAIARKIRALLAKTVEAGATEAEAMMAMTKAHELLAKYQLQLSDLDLREEGTTLKTFDYNEVAESLYAKVGKYCECKGWRGSTLKQVPVGKRGKTKWQNVYEINFLGVKSDAIFAEWLLAALISFVENQQADYYLDHDHVSTAMSRDFVVGCCARINERLAAEIQKRDFDRKFSASTGRDLVPLKNAMITEELNRLGLRFTSYSNTRRYANDSAYAAGKAAGDNVGFNRPVHSEDRSVRLLK